MTHDPEPSEVPGIVPDWKPWVSQNLGHEPVLIQSRRHWREELRRRGLKNEYYDENC